MNQIIPKKWGHEEIIVSNEKYCGKFLVFNYGHKGSFHYHCKKDETFFVQSGMIVLEWLDLNQLTNEEAKKRYEDGLVKTEILEEGQSFHLPPYRAHRVYSITPKAVIVEFSTQDKLEDSYRIIESF